LAGEGAFDLRVERIAAAFERRFRRPVQWSRMSAAAGASVIPAARWPAA
jgi:hypothetical protein